MKNASIYTTTNGCMAYQMGSSRTLVDTKGCKTFQKKEGGEWRNGRHGYAIDLIDKVKQAIANKA
jgi:hypothetical protein